MSFANIILRIRNLLFNPGREWEVIADEHKTRKMVFVRFVVPLLCVASVASVVGSLLFVSRMVFSFGYVVYKVMLLWCSLSSGLYLSSFLITEVMAQYIGSKNHNKTFELAAYSSGVVFLVITVVQLFPFFNELLVLAFYAGYLYWRGIPYLIKIQEHDQKQMAFGILSFVIVALTYSIVVYFFVNVLSTIFISS